MDNQKKLGRPSNSSKEVEKQMESIVSDPIVRNETQREEAPRDRAASLGGHNLQLAVVNTNIPGHKLFWVNDDGGGLDRKYSQGFDFVTREEAGEDRKTRTLIVENKDLDTRVSRHAGVLRDGSPMKAYLMKCTTEQWEAIERQRYDQADRWDSAIKRQEVGIEQGRKYVPTGYETTL